MRGRSVGTYGQKAYLLAVLFLPATQPYLNAFLQAGRRLIFGLLGVPNIGL